MERLRVEFGAHGTHARGSTGAAAGAPFATDGTFVLFERDDEAGATQVFAVPVAGGEVRVVTTRGGDMRAARPRAGKAEKWEV
jgi:hypothetical protein